MYDSQTCEYPCGSARKVSPYFIFFILAMVVSFIGLGILRLYSNRLEARLHAINLQIESYEMQETEMHRVLSSLTSPEAIYGYSQKKLGMVANVKTGVVHVARIPALKEEMKVASIASSHGWNLLFSLFSSPATAKD